MAVQPNAGEFRDAELLFQIALRVVVLKSPVINAAFDSAGSVEEGSSRGFKKLRGSRQKRFPRMEKLQFVSKRLLGKRAG